MSESWRTSNVSVSYFSIDQTERLQHGSLGSAFNGRPFSPSSELHSSLKQLSQQVQVDVSGSSEPKGIKGNEGAEGIEAGHLSSGRLNEDKISKAEEYVEQMREMLIDKVKRSDKFVSDELKQQYVELATDMRIFIKEDAAYGWLADYQGLWIKIAYREVGYGVGDASIKKFGHDGEALPQFMFKKEFLRDLAHEMRHLTPINNALPTHGVASSFVSSRHSASPAEADANQFSSSLLDFRDKRLIEDF